MDSGFNFLGTLSQEHDSPGCALDSAGLGRRSPEEDASKDIMVPRRLRPGELHFWETESRRTSLLGIAHPAPILLLKRFPRRPLFPENFLPGAQHFKNLGNHPHAQEYSPEMLARNAAPTLIKPAVRCLTEVYFYAIKAIFRCKTSISRIIVLRALHSSMFSPTNNTLPPLSPQPPLLIHKNWCRILSSRAFADDFGVSTVTFRINAG